MVACIGQGDQKGKSGSHGLSISHGPRNCSAFAIMSRIAEAAMERGCGCVLENAGHDNNFASGVRKTKRMTKTPPSTNKHQIAIHEH